MKRLSTIILIALFALFASISSFGQSLNDTEWSVFAVRDSKGFERSDISILGGSLSSTAKVVDNKFYFEKEIYSLSGENVVKKNFALERSYDFVDQYGQKGKILFLEDPSYVDEEYRYVIFIKFVNADKGRVFLCTEPKDIKKPESQESEGIHTANLNRANTTMSAESYETLPYKRGMAKAAMMAGQDLYGPIENIGTPDLAAHKYDKGVQVLSQIVTKTYRFTLTGRKLIGTVPLPTFRGSKYGTVVVKIWVDQYGKVTAASPGDKGTTVNNKKLWISCRSAAMNARFNMSPDAPIKQEGSISFVFSE